MAGGKKWSWHAAAAAMNVSVKYLRQNMNNLPPGRAAKLEEYLSGD